MEHRADLSQVQEFRLSFPGMKCEPPASDGMKWYKWCVQFDSRHREAFLRADSQPIVNAVNIGTCRDPEDPEADRRGGVAGPLPGIDARERNTFYETSKV